ncbi:MAG: FHA domain-containing protein [Planctomycetes bacterium]|nr:FHA domain-containing protein [Planctomycetota bacterium]
MMRLIYEEDGQKKEFLIRGKSPIRIGRDPECEIPTKNKSVSRRHCTCTPQGNTLAVHDDGGANGVFINDEKVSDGVAKNGDIVRAGKFGMKFVAEEAEDSTMVEPAAPKADDFEGTIVDPGFASGGGLVAKVSAAAAKKDSPEEIAKLFSQAAASATPAVPDSGVVVPAPGGAAGGGVSGSVLEQLGPGIPAPRLEIAAGMPPKTIDVTTKKVTLGAQEDNIVLLKAEGVSRHHTEVLFKDKAWIVRDLGSKNGTFLNSKKITEAALKNGDVIAIGQVQIRVHLKGGAGAGGAGGAADPKRKQRMMLIGGLVGFMVLILAVKVMVPDTGPGGGGGSGGGSQVICQKCNKPGHTIEKCPYQRVSGEYLDVQNKLMRALEALFKDGSRNSEAEAALKQASSTGQAIKNTYGNPPLEQAAIKTLWEILSTFREKAAIDFRDFKWKDPKERLSEIAVNRELYGPIKDTAGKLVEWIEFESRMSETLREGEDYLINNNPEDAYRTYRKIETRSVYAATSQKKRDEIKDSYRDRRVREIDAKMASNDYDAALKLANEALDIFGGEYQDVKAELIPRQSECERFVSTQKLFDEVAALTKQGEYDAARRKLNELQAPMLRLDWIKKRRQELADEIEVRSLIVQVTQKYNEGQGQVAVTMLTPRSAIGPAEVVELLQKIQKVMQVHADMVASRNRNDPQGAREKALVLLELEKDTTNAYYKEAKPIADFNAPQAAKIALDTAKESRRVGDGLEAESKALFEAERMADGLAKADEAAKKFSGCREQLEKARAFYASDVNEVIKQMFRQAEGGFNFAKNAGQLAPQRRLGMLRIARAKLSVSGTPSEQQKHSEISGLITKIETESGIK